MRPGIIQLSAAALLLSAAAPQKLTKEMVSDFVAVQGALWDKHDLEGYYATIAEDAVLTTISVAQHAERRKKQQDRTEAEQAFKHIGAWNEVSTTDSVTLAPDGQSATVLAHETASFMHHGKPVQRCAVVNQTVSLRHGKLVTTALEERQILPCPLRARVPRKSAHNA